MVTAEAKDGAALLVGGGQVLDLYVYNIGIKQGLIPISTVVGVFKSVIGVTLLFGANGISKAIRGESII